jgi:alpha-L-fucosidase
MFDERIDKDEYAKLKDKFACEKFNADQWVDVASLAGCKYMVVTARHHDGFSLFTTHFGDFDAVHSAVKKDLIGEYVKAAHRAGMRTGIYYSPLDWRYPGFFFPDMYRTNAEEMKKQTYTQVRELLTQYGQVDILWYDGGEDNWLGFGGLMWDGGKGGWYTRGFDKPYTGAFSWEPIKLNKMVRTLQPHVVISQRSGWMGDFESQEVRLKGKPASERPWELCTVLSGGSWGWVPSCTENIMSLDSLIRLLATVVCQDGNLLLNVGPKPDGSIETKQAERLKELGNFLSKNGESIYNTRGGFYDPRWGGTTLADNAIYVHVLYLPSEGKITIPPSPRKVISAGCLENNDRVKYEQTPAGIILRDISEREPEADYIIKLTLK